MSVPGFKTAERRGLTLQAADNKQIDTQLEIVDIKQTVEVISAAPLIDTTSATSGTVITEEQLTEIPSMSRVTTLFATLSPGVVAQDQNQNVAHLWSYNASSQFSVNGGRNNIRSNNFELDGMPNIRTDGKVGFVPPPEAVQEFRVQMNAYDASLGRQAGATVQMVIKSGNSAYHGGLYWYNQNNLLNASTGAYQTRVPTQLGLDHVWTISATKVLNMRWNVSRFVDDNRDKGAGFDPTVLGFPVSYVAQMEKPSFPRINGFCSATSAPAAPVTLPEPPTTPGAPT